MSDWYYARAGQTLGPVSRMRIEEMARAGELNPATDLLWTDSMTEWLPAGQVPGIFPETPTAAALPPATMASAPSPSDRFLNPYAPPQSGNTRAVVATPQAGVEIEPGSEPIDIGQIIKRSWQLTIQHYGFIFLVGVVYFVLLVPLNVAFQYAMEKSGMAAQNGQQPDFEALMKAPDFAMNVGILVGLYFLLMVVSIYLWLGLTRIGLNLVSGAPVSVGQLFGEGGKLLKLIGSSILLWFPIYLLLILGSVGIGLAKAGEVALVGFIVVALLGFLYVGLRFGQYATALVDRDMGAIECLRYSSRITTKQKLRLVLLILVAFVLIIVGIIPCGLGLFLVYPMLWLMSVLVYRWMQYGARGIADPRETGRNHLS